MRIVSTIFAALALCACAQEHQPGPAASIDIATLQKEALKERQRAQPGLPIHIDAFHKRAYYFMGNKTARDVALASCDRKHGTLTTFNVPGHSVTDCDAVIEAQAQLYRMNPSLLRKVKKQCESRVDERTLFSECKAANLAEQRRL